MILSDPLKMKMVYEKSRHWDEIVITRYVFHRYQTDRKRQQEKRFFCRKTPEHKDTNMILNFMVLVKRFNIRVVVYKQYIHCKYIVHTGNTE